MKLLDFLFKINRKQNEQKSKYGGLIKTYNLEEFWDSLSKDERQFIKECYSKGLSTNNKGTRDVDSLNIELISDKDASNFLNSMSQWAIQNKRYDLAEKLAQQAEKINASKTQKESIENNGKNYIDLHFTYNRYIEIYYKKRDIDKKAIEKCVEYCIKDINILPHFLKQWLQEMGPPLPRIPSVDRLRIIYEKQGRYEEAIRICELALKYGLEDNSKHGYKGHIERLKKKLNSTT